MNDLWIDAIMFWLACAALGFCVAGEGRRGSGFGLGFLLGPIGVIVAAILSNRDKKEVKASSTGSALSDPNGYSARRMLAKYKPKVRVILKGAKATPAAAIPLDDIMPCPECEQPVLLDGMVPSKSYACPHCRKPFVLDV